MDAVKHAPEASEALRAGELRYAQQVDMIVEHQRRGEVREGLCAAVPGRQSAAHCRPRPPNTVWTT